MKRTEGQAKNERRLCVARLTTSAPFWRTSSMAAFLFSPAGCGASGAAARCSTAATSVRKPATRDGVVVKRSGAVSGKMAIQSREERCTTGYGIAATPIFRHAMQFGGKGRA